MGPRIGVYEYRTQLVDLTAARDEPSNGKATAIRRENAEKEKEIRGSRESCHLLTQPLFHRQRLDTLLAAWPEQWEDG